MYQFWVWILLTIFSNCNKSNSKCNHLANLDVNNQSHTERKGNFHCFKISMSNNEVSTLNIPLKEMKQNEAWRPWMCQQHLTHRSIWKYDDLLLCNDSHQISNFC
jgi:hypothetical protein